MRDDVLVINRVGNTHLEATADLVTETFHIPEAGFIFIDNQLTALINMFSRRRQGNAPRIAFDKLRINFTFQLFNSAAYHGG